MQCSGKLVLETHSLAIGGARWMNKREPGVCISFSTYSISISRFSSNRARMMKGPRSEYDSTGKKLRNSASFSSLPRRSTPPPLLLPLHSAYSLRASVHSTRAGKKWEKEREKEILLKPIELTSLLPSKTRYITRPPPTRWRWEESFAGRFDAVRAALAQPISTSSLRRLVIDRCSGSFFWLFYFILFYFIFSNILNLNRFLDPSAGLIWTMT